VFIRGENIWNTESSGKLQCRLDGSSTSPALFVNETLVLCDVPKQASPGSRVIDLTIDGLIYSQNSMTLNFIPEPSITSINVTSVYRTLNEDVYIEISGADLDMNIIDGGTLFIRVGNTVIKESISPPQSAKGFILPPQLDLGTYSVSVSTDGVNFRPSSTTFTVTISDCPSGSTCTQSVATPCPTGTYCPDGEVLEPMKCPSGFL